MYRDLIRRTARVDRRGRCNLGRRVSGGGRRPGYEESNQCRSKERIVLLNRSRLTRVQACRTQESPRVRVETRARGEGDIARRRWKVGNGGDGVGTVVGICGSCGERGAR